MNPDDLIALEDLCFQYGHEMIAAFVADPDFQARIRHLRKEALASRRQTHQPAPFKLEVKI